MQRKMEVLYPEGSGHSFNTLEPIRNEHPDQLLFCLFPEEVNV